MFKQLQCLGQLVTLAPIWQAGFALQSVLKLSSFQTKLLGLRGRKQFWVWIE